MFVAQTARAPVNGSIPALAMMIRMCGSMQSVQETTISARRICKIMMSCPKLGLDTVLTENGVKISPEVVEEVLKKFENAGMHAYQFFEWAGKQRNYNHSVRTYHIMIGALAKIRQYQIMWELVKAMRRNDILNLETFCVIMRKYARAQKVDEAIYTFNVMDKYGLEPNLVAFNGLLSALCKSQNIRKAQEIFDSMKQRFVPDPKTFSILLEGWGREPNLPKARQVFREMTESGCEPDIVTYGIMVDILCKTGRVEEAVVLVKDMKANGCSPTSFIYSVLVHAFGTEKQIDDAVDAFLEMERNGIIPDVGVYNALISAFCKVNKFENVYRVVKAMKKKGVTPNSRTCNVIIKSLIGLGENEEAFKVFRKMIKLCDPDSDTYTIMIKMFCENGKIDRAQKVWDFMKKKGFVPSMHTFSVLINGLCASGEARRACILVEEMIENGIRPPGPTFKKLKQLLLKEDREDVLKFLEEKMKLLISEPLCD